jgi:predicted nucleotidyltransferase
MGRGKGRAPRGLAPGIIWVIGDKPRAIWYGIMRYEMDNQISGDPILSRFRAALIQTYGDRLERAVLYGSRARGDNRPDSDYDIAVFLREPDGWLNEVNRLADLGTDILLDTGAVISATPFPAGAYRERTGFMHELRKDGLDL